MTAGTGQQDSHERRDWEKLEMHRRVAAVLRLDPEPVLVQARANLRRWQQSMGHQPYYQEWETLLDRLDVDALIDLITRDDAEGRRLRQSTPFVGVVPRAVRDSIFRGS